MKLIYSPDREKKPDETVIGGKGASLFRLYNAGLPVPRPICIGIEGYNWFVDHNNLREKISLELNRKDLSDMRWEEIWDISLTIHNLFIRGNMPSGLQNELQQSVLGHFPGTPLVIRSSAPAEDSAARSYAGLHSSCVNIKASQLEKYIKKVWASLWSDRAILYRQELGLDILGSSMGVVIQEFIVGDSSGVMFTEDPTDSTRMIIEAVHGLNQGLVDGTVAPDRWVLSRRGGELLRHTPPETRHVKITASEHSGIHVRPCNDAEKNSAPLDPEAIQQVTALAAATEKLCASAIDIEWTRKGDRCYLLQARPVTAGNRPHADDKRSWYLSLNRSYENLKQLRDNIENKLLVQMQHDAARLANTKLEMFTEQELAAEIRRRISLNEHWISAYWNSCIPFAHGVRLFGETYNDIIEPNDPFEFVHLLTGQTMLSTERNKLLLKCAQLVKSDDHLLYLLEQGQIHRVENEAFLNDLKTLKTHFSMGFLEADHPDILNSLLSSTILEYISLETPPRQHLPDSIDDLKSVFLEKAEHHLPIPPRDLLELAKASYRLRDDDNIHLGRIGQELERALAEARKRLKQMELDGIEGLSAVELCSALEGEVAEKVSRTQPDRISRPRDPSRVRARQLLGQPASRGISKGRARVISHPSDLGSFKRGEILVIDSIDPTMTFFAPLAAGIVERRGGMLIHGAIIAREYGIPCITGVVDATSKIHTGDIVTVDGFLGICTVEHPER